MGAIRSSVSCSNTPAQYFMLKAQADQRTAGEKERFKEILRKRYGAVKTLVQAHENHRVLRALPFNSGYFMSFVCSNVGAERIRQELLNNYGIGTIALGDRYLRVAFSSIEEAHIEEVFKTIYEVAEKLA
jgi:aspartate/methionine/tyrosine aminotransferase